MYYVYSRAPNQLNNSKKCQMQWCSIFSQINIMRVTDIQLVVQSYKVILICDESRSYITRNSL